MNFKREQANELVVDVEILQIGNSQAAAQLLCISISRVDDHEASCHHALVAEQEIEAFARHLSALSILSVQTYIGVSESLCQDIGTSDSTIIGSEVSPSPIVAVRIAKKRRSTLCVVKSILIQSGPSLRPIGLGEVFLIECHHRISRRYGSFFLESFIIVNIVVIIHFPSYFTESHSSFLTPSSRTQSLLDQPPGGGSAVGAAEPTA